MRDVGSLNGTYVNRASRRPGHAAQRRRGPDRQVPVRLLRRLTPYRADAPSRAASIGAVLEQLKPDFPDVTISKIRFLEDEGLVTPQRTPSGYRTFSERDVERLRYVLAAQRDRFWPLKVIREHLDALDRGLHTRRGRQRRGPDGASRRAC